MGKKIKFKHSTFGPAATALNSSSRVGRKGRDPPFFFRVKRLMMLALAVVGVGVGASAFPSPFASSCNRPPPHPIVVNAWNRANNSRRTMAIGKKSPYQSLLRRVIHCSAVQEAFSKAKSGNERKKKQRERTKSKLSAMSCIN